jgi:hypothetical protein
MEGTYHKPWSKSPLFTHKEVRVNFPDSTVPRDTDFQEGFSVQLRLRPGTRSNLPPSSSTKVDTLLYGGNNLEKAREIFAKAVKYRPRIRLTIRQRTRVLQRWPDHDERG